MSIQTQQADYDRPAVWLTAAQAGGGSCYQSDSVDKLLASASSKELQAALPDYAKVQQELIGNVVAAPLVYGRFTYLAQPYLKGVGGNALGDFPWVNARIIKHSVPTSPSPSGQ